MKKQIEDSLSKLNFKKKRELRFKNICSNFENEMSKPDVRKDFNENLLKYTDLMHPLGRPLFNTKVPPDKLVSAVNDFWQEINTKAYVKENMSTNLTKTNLISEAF